jgi:hypothetical protein
MNSNLKLVMMMTALTSSFEEPQALPHYEIENQGDVPMIGNTTDSYQGLPGRPHSADRKKKRKAARKARRQNRR